MQAKWIAPAGASKEKNLYFRARRIINLKKLPKNAELKVSAESFYKIWVNGQLAGAGPARGSKTLNFYDSIEIGPLLRPGRNIVAALAYSTNSANFIANPAAGAFLAEIEGLAWTGDGKWLVLKNDGEWLDDKLAFAPQVGPREWRDLRKEPQGWLLGSDKRKWQKPEILGPAESGMAGKKLLPRPVPMQIESVHLAKTVAQMAIIPPFKGHESENVAELTSSETHSPVDAKLAKSASSLALGGTQSAIIDPPGAERGVSLTFGFGQEIIGFFKMEISAPAGTIVDVSYDEELENGRLIAARHVCYKMTDRYVLKNGANTIGTTIQERGFRFVEVAIRNFSESVEIKSVKAIDRRYPVSRRGEFHCSDELLNKVWSVCVETLSTCATDIFNDCPWRERSFWVNDLIVENLTWLQAMGDPRLNAHALRLALSNVREDGWLPGVCPDDGNPHIVLIPTNLFIPLMLKDYLLYSGDLELVKELLPKALALQRNFDSLVDGDGLIRPPSQYWNFFDWSYELNGVKLDKRRTSLLEWLRCLSLSEAASLLELLGGKKEAAELRRKLQPIADAVMKRLWPEGSPRCSDWLEENGKPSLESSQLTHALALLSGAAPEARKAEAIAALDDASIRMPDLYLHNFVFQAMEANGMAKAAIARVVRYWGGMAKNGTPTLWEIFVCDPKGKKAVWNAGSLCHGFGASAIGALQRILLGVRPLAPGFAEFAFEPKPCGLEAASGSVPTPNGDIRVEWRVESGVAKAKIEIPQGLIAKLADGSKLKSGIHNLTFTQEI